MILRAPRIACAVGIFAGLLAAGGCGGGGGTTRMLTKAELMDPTACQTCHQQQYQDWSGSMHAYASADPVFLAMNQKGQRETNGALGDFCVKCHAPVALAQGLTTDGQNLATLPPSVQGVTCFFCHSANAVEGTHNNPLQLATDGSLFGPFADPVAGTPHRSTSSPLFDLTRVESAQACGSCHDIVNQHGAAVERTFTEWQATLFSDPKLGQTCVRCHMNQSEGPASSISAGKTRHLGSHALPGVDVALTDFPETDAQRQQVQSLLDSAVSGTLCLTDALRIEVTLDNVAAGHFVPSGATPDRRIWVQVTAFAGDQVIYQSGLIPPGQSIETIDDPDLWLIRDCLVDENQSPVHMFWEAASLTSNQIPGSVQPSVLDPTTFTRSHVKYVYPVMTALPAAPDRITMQMFIKPVGDDVLAELVASGDLDRGIAARVPQFSFAQANMVWTPQTGKVPFDVQTRAPVTGLSCVTTAAQYFSVPTVARTHARCPP